jgi:hypothetical protein
VRCTNSVACRIRLDRCELHAFRAVTTNAQHPVATRRGRELLNKVPGVTIYFWTIKVLCTTVGETAPDYLAGNLSLGLTNTTFMTGGLLIGTLIRSTHLTAGDVADSRAEPRNAEARRPFGHRAPTVTTSHARPELSSGDQ